MDDREHIEKFMKRAIELARINITANNGGPFGAVVVRDGQIIGEGSNMVTSSNDPSAHAEIVAIREACKHLGDFQLKGCEIYASCEPCPMCLGAIYWARPDKVYFAASSRDANRAYFDDSYIYQECQKKAGERKIPFVQILREDAIDVFLEWLENDKKIPY